LGGGYRKENIFYNYNSGGPDIAQGGRSISYGYGEIRIPIVSASNNISFINSLELTSSFRYEHYSDFGGNLSPKVGISYRPVNDLNLRGTWSRAFKAPTLTQYIGDRGITMFTASTLRANAPAGSVIAVLTGANPDLKPEKSTSLTAGFDFTPRWLSGAKLSVTYFHIRYRGRIDNPTSAVVGIYDNSLYAPYIEKGVTADQYLTAVSSATYVSNLAGSYLPGQVYAIYDLYSQNLYRQNISGVDITGSYDISMGSARVSFFGNMTFLKIRRQNLSTLPETTITGTIFNPSKFRARGGVQVQGRTVGGSLIANHIGPEIDNSNSFNTASPAKDVSISSQTTLDAQLVFGSTEPGSSLDGFQLSFAVQNLLNAKPPRINSNSGLSGYPGIGYDSANYSAVGRYVSVTVSKRW
jgi:outer membrane receptor protein involved in Fe transport